MTNWTTRNCKVIKDGKTTERINCISTDKIYKGKKVWESKEGKAYIIKKINYIEYFIEVEC